jgi:hypothetical protein
MLQPPAAAAAAAAAKTSRQKRPATYAVGENWAIISPTTPKAMLLAVAPAIRQICLQQCSWTSGRQTHVPCCCWGMIAAAWTAEQVSQALNMQVP